MNKEEKGLEDPIRNPRSKIRIGYRLGCDIGGTFTDFVLVE